MLKKRHAYLRHQDLVTWTSYVLFTLVLIGVITSTIIPFMHLLMQPQVLRVNVFIFLISLTAGALLPVIISYITGDVATRSKNKTLHRYNGVIFGLLAWWLAVLFGTINANYLLVHIQDTFSSVVPVAIANAWPILATAATVSILAYFYHKKATKKHGVIVYKPYQFTLLSVVFIVTILLPLSQLLDFGGNASYTIDANYVAISISTCVALLAISLVVLRNTKTTNSEKVILSIIGITIASVALYAISQLLPYVTLNGNIINTIWSLTPFVISIIIWAIYLIVTARDLKK